VQRKRSEPGIAVGISGRGGKKANGRASTLCSTAWENPFFGYRNTDALSVRLFYLPSKKKKEGEKGATDLSPETRASRKKPRYENSAGLNAQKKKKGGRAGTWGKRRSRSREKREKNL